MSTLKEKSQSILDEKSTKILPENIKEGVQIFDIAGTAKPYPFNEKNNMIYQPSEYSKVFYTLNSWHYNNRLMYYTIDGTEYWFQFWFTDISRPIGSANGDSWKIAGCFSTSYKFSAPAVSYVPHLIRIYLKSGSNIIGDFTITVGRASLSGIDYIGFTQDTLNKLDADGNRTILGDDDLLTVDNIAIEEVSIR